MALWICSRPPEKCHPAEVYVAERLSRLSDEWIVSWGYRYNENGGDDPEREGDFLVQSPAGHICTIEVKSGRLRQFVLTGFWEFEAGNNPADQVYSQRSGTLARLEATQAFQWTPYVHCSLALPNVDFVSGDRFNGQLQRGRILSKKDLDMFPDWWDEHVASHPMRIGGPQARACFLKAFATGATPKALRFFINETDALILRQMEAASETLSLVAGNRQLLVEGGCGSGKTFLAIEQARQWAEKEAGERVLLLCYNLPLTAQIANSVERRPPTRGEIVVLSWEGLAARLLARARVPLEIPTDASKRWEYFTVEVPGLLLQIADDGDILAEFDSLVVDEGQDHDTVFPPLLGRPELPGWWSFYLRMLHDKGAANIAVFYDPTQRPRFRDSAGFSATRLATVLSQPAHVRLPRAERYTRPVYEFLRRIQLPNGTGPGATLRPPLTFREGPEVEERTCAREQTSRVVGDIIERWIELGLCRPQDIIILGLRRERSQSSLGEGAAVGKHPLCDYSPVTEPGTVPYLNIHRAKGLDRLGVIVIDLPPLSELIQTADVNQLEPLFAAASRARQLIAIISLL